jgi:hypothetical protein
MEEMPDVRKYVMTAYVLLTRIRARMADETARDRQCSVNSPGI